MSSADSAPDMSDITTPGAADANQSTDANQPTGVASPPVASQQQTVTPPEIGPVTFAGAVRIIGAHYENAFNLVTWEHDPIVRDGSIISFKIAGLDQVVAQGRIWFSPTIKVDENGNGTAVVGVRDITYPRRK